MRDIHLSIVSHRHGPYIDALLRDLEALPITERLQVTLVDNLPDGREVDLQDSPFPVRVIANPQPQGFGANHNLAFSAAPLAAERHYFVVLNPDLRISTDVLSPLTAALHDDAHIGVAAPAVRSTDGTLEDSARELPTPQRLLRKVAGHRGVWPGGEHHARFYPDWIAGMFMLFRAEVFGQLGGFDERFFLYYEDVDLCSRLWLSGYSVLVDPTLSIVHDAQRTSRRNWRYAAWHLRSILRFFASDVYRGARRLHRQRRT